MARETRPAPEGLYNLLRLNRIFAWSSLLLLISVIWMIWKDYNREWKHYQRAWFAIETRKTELDIQAALKAIPPGELEAVETKLELATEELGKKAKYVQGVEAELDKLSGPLYEAKQADGFAKAEWEAQRYRFENSQETLGPDSPATLKAHQTLVEMRNAWGDAEARKEVLEEDEKKKLKALAMLTEARDAAKKRRRELKFDVARLEAKKEKVNPGLVSQLRNLPVMEMANPSIKVDQVILEHIRDDYHFANIAKADRCMTCHKGIDDADYAVDPATGEFAHSGLREIMAETYPDESDRRRYTRAFMAHPNQDLYLGGASPHPIERYGCTVCHSGQGRSLTFVTANHHPSDPHEDEVWKEELSWHEVELWRHPMTPTTHVHSACFKCHQQEREIPGADDFNRGRKIFRWAGCFGCHKTAGFEDYGKTGPSLTEVASKLDQGWVFHWIRQPRSFRPGTKMPTFFDQSNNSDDPEATVAEVAAITKFLYENSTKIDYTEANGGVDASGADTEAGWELVHIKGCLGCHALGDLNPRKDLPYAPGLGGIGSKVGFDWLYYWLKDPKRYYTHARMPDMRLTNEEARDIAAYLATLKKPQMEPRPHPEVNGETLGALVLERLKEKQTDAKARKMLAGMTRDQRLLYLGERMITQNGCYSCHDIKGFEDATPIAAELTGTQAIGSKETDQLDFGYIHGETKFSREEEQFTVHIEHHPGQPGGRRYEWLKLKLMEPRIWDRLKDKTRTERLRMPNFYFTPEQVSSLTTFLLGLTSHEVPLDNQKILTPREAALAEGSHVAEEKNCIGCHVIIYDRLTLDGVVNDKEVKGAVEGKETARRKGNIFFSLWRDSPENGWSAGDVLKIPEAAVLKKENRWSGEIEDVLMKVYVDEFGMDEQDVPGLLPPVLVGEGSKVQGDWLFGFLKEPFELRPWLDVTMPTFHLTDAESAALVSYFAALEGEGLPYEHIREKESSLIEEMEKTLPDYLQRTNRLFQSEEAKCVDCHIVAGHQPTEDPASLAPDLLFARERLRPGWLRRWLTNPQSLQPGTKMPTPAWGDPFKKYLDLDGARQVEAMKNLLYHLGEQAVTGGSGN